MNFKFILQLSLFGLIMAFATVSLIPEKVEPLFWLIVFVFCAFVIAKVCTGRYFLYGFFTSIINSVWITGVHLLFFNSYAAHHPDLATMGNNLYYFATRPRMLMLVLGIPFGIAFGIILGLFCVVASKLVQPRVAE